MTESAPRERQPISLRELALGVRDDFFQWDRGLVGTFVTLCWRPGAVARGYVLDRDQRYTSPWRYLLFGVFVSVAASWLAIHQLGRSNHMQVSDRSVQFLLDNAALLTLLMLPLFALLMRIFFIGLRVRFVDALVVLFYTQGHINLLGAGSLVVSAATGNSNVAVAAAVVLQIYFVWACAAFANGPWWRRLIASVLTLVGAQLVNGGIVYLASRFS